MKSDITIDLSDRDVVICNFRAGLAEAARLGFAGKDIRTSAPALLLERTGGVRDLAWSVPDGLGEDLRMLARRFAQRCLEELCGGDATSPVYIAAIVAFARVRSLIQSCAGMLDLSPEARVALMLPRTGHNAKDAILAGAWPVVMGSFKDHRVVEVSVEAADIPYYQDEPDKIGDVLLRLRAQPASAFTDKIAQLLARFRRVERDHILVFSDNELVRDCVAALVRAPLAIAPVCIGPVKTAQVEPPAEDFVEAVLALSRDCLPQPVAERFGAMIVDQFQNRFEEVWRVFAPTYAHWKDAFRGAAGKEVRAILGNIPRRPEEFAFVAAAHAAEKRVILCQHGISRELTDAPDQVAFLNESALGTLFLSYGPGVAQALRRSGFTRAETQPIGLPNIMRKMSERPLLGSKWQILYASTGLYGGSVNIDRGASDFSIAEFETMMVRDVLSTLPHNVLYKCYPALRYTDPDPAVEEARRHGNMTIFDRRLDLRYILPYARLIVTSRGTSTFGWVFNSNRPMVFINIPGQLELLPDVKEAVSRATFFFDAGRPDFAESLRDFLSQDLEKIEARHKDLAPHRAHLLRTVLDIDNDHRTDCIRNAIMKHCYDQ